MESRLFSLFASLWTVIIFGFPLSLNAENWPQWRGARLDGVSQETGLPTSWSQTENVAWKLPLPGPAGASPVVWGDRIFLTAAEGQDLVLLCISADGKILWKRKMGTGNADVRGDEGNSASPSPSTDGKHVWAMMATGDLACYDFSGKEVWKFDLEDRYGKFDIAFGMTSTPVLDGNRLYLQLIHTGSAQVVALDKATGKQVWLHERKSDARAECEHSYASPVMYQDQERKFLLTHGADYVVAHDLKDGKELWRCGGLNPPPGGTYRDDFRFVSSPLAVPGLIVVPSCKNGKTLGLSPTGAGDITDQSQWQKWTRDDRTPDVPSPLMHDGLVYLCGEDGILLCLDAKTGEQIYLQRTHSQRHRASPVYADGKLYLTARDGIVSVVKAGRDFELLASNDIGEGISASPAISGGRIYLRGFDNLYAIEAAN